VSHCLDCNALVCYVSFQAMALDAMLKPSTSGAGLPYMYCRFQYIIFLQLFKICSVFLHIIERCNHVKMFKILHGYLYIIFVLVHLDA
jgi:hypothetical protein